MTKCPQKVKATKTQRTNIFFHWTDFYFYGGWPEILPPRVTVVLMAATTYGWAQPAEWGGGDLL